MALDKVIDSAQLDADLTAVADAIRTKGGTTGELEFPSGFVSAVEGIQAGGGGVSEQDALELLATGDWPSGDIVVNGETIGDFALNGKQVTSVFAPNALSIGKRSFADCATLTVVDCPSALTLRSGASYTFQNCPELTTVNLPEVTKAGNKMFIDLAKLKHIYLPKLQSVDGDQFIENTAVEELRLIGMTGRLNQKAIRYNEKLTFVDLGHCTSVGSQALRGCTVLSAVVLRNTAVASLAGIDAFQSTPFASGGTVGTVYVPSVLISEYQQATNWSTLYAAGTCNFVAIEGSEYE